ncbi:MAG: family 16 glycoside hydrolase [Bacillota bacterium]
MMKWVWSLGIVVALAWGFALQAAEKTVVIGFEDQPVGKMPADFTAAVTPPGPAGAWVVREDATAPEGKKVLVQESTDPTNGRYPLCIYDKLMAKDVEVRVKFRPVSGKVDQAAGIVVRYQDKNNYYIARANGLEDNVRLYKVENGKRKQFAGVDVKAPAAGQWHVLTLKANGSKFEVGMDGKKLFEAEDATFKEAGKVGVWTKADSVMEFDEIDIEKP